MHNREEKEKEHEKVEKRLKNVCQRIEKGMKNEDPRNRTWIREELNRGN
jgi:hypothetical protein